MRDNTKKLYSLEQVVEFIGPLEFEPKANTMFEFGVMSGKNSIRKTLRAVLADQEAEELSKRNLTEGD